MSALSDKLVTLGVTTPTAAPRAETALNNTGKGVDDIPASSATPVKDVLEQISNAVDRAEVKGCAWKDVGPFARTTQGDYDIQVTEINTISGGVELYARAWDGDGDQIGFGKDGSVDLERFKFYNPPVMLPDGTTYEKVNSDGITMTVDRFEENLPGAIKQSLEYAIKSCVKTLKSQNIVEGKKGSTVSTFYPDADPESTSVDGRTGPSGKNDLWATMIANAGVVSQDTCTNCAGLYFDTTSNTDRWQVLYLAVFGFDTSSIPDNDLVYSATFSVYGASKGDDLGITPELALVEGVTASDTAVAAGDWDSMIVKTTEFASRITYANISTAGYNDFSLNSNGLANISKTGVSKFCISEGKYFIDGATPAWSNNLTSQFSPYWADQAGTTNDPKLVVTHFAANKVMGVSLANASKINGVEISGNVAKINGVS